MPTSRFLGYIFIRNVTFPYLSANQVLWLLREFREFLKIFFIFLLLSLSWEILIYRTTKASGIAEPRDEGRIKCLKHGIDKTLNETLI